MHVFPNPVTYIYVVNFGLAKIVVGNHMNVVAITVHG